MTMKEMQRAVARLLTDRAYREGFFAGDVGGGEAYGLTPGEFAILRRLDPRRLEIITEGYTGKRFEVIESACPRTLAILERLQPRTRQDYLARTAFPKDPNEEIRTFAQYAQRLAHAPHVQRFVEDVLNVELALHGCPRPTVAPITRSGLAHGRPQRARHTTVVRLQGPLPPNALAGEAEVPKEYAMSPREALVARDGRGVVVEHLTNWSRALLDACDGNRTGEDLAAHFLGDAFPTLERWLRLRILEDAAAEDVPSIG